MKKILFYLLFYIGGMILVSGCVAPDQYRLLENRITAIEVETYNQASDPKAGSPSPEELESLKLKLHESTQTARENNAEIRYEIQQIKEKFQHMEGLIEEINHEFGTKGQTRQQEFEKRLDRMDNAISRNYERIIILEKHMGFEPSVADQKEGEEASPEKSENVEPPVKSVPEKIQKIETGSEQELYDQAKKLFDAGDRENARAEFENFIQKYPKSQNADNARFWIADSYYAEKWYEKAILEYQKVLETYPDSNKAAAARLKQGYSFAALGEKANAKLILKELIKRHPDSDEAKYAQEKLKSLN